MSDANERYSEKEIANDILDFLSEQHYKAFKTSELVAKLQQATGKQYNDDYIRVREVLRKLNDCNRVKKHVLSKAKHTWRIKCKEWDTDHPFSRWDDEESEDNEPDTTDDKPEPKFDDGGNVSAEVPYPTVKAYDDTRVRQRLSDCEADIIDLHAESTQLKAKIKELEDHANRTAPVIVVKTNDDKPVKLKNKTLPRIFERVLQLAGARRNVLLVGPAGCGKTYLASLISESLKLPFFPMSFNEEVGKAELIGVRTPNMTKGTNEFQASPFLEAFETGGVALLDELDAANPNALLALNSALANGYVSVPLRKGNTTAVKHKNFIAIGTANTFGSGANRVYVGRNQLDESSLDRFRIGTIECDYDPIVEMTVCPHDDIRHGLQKVRTNLNKYGIRRIVSTRFLEDAYIMHSVAKWDYKTIFDTLTTGWKDEEILRAKEGMAV